MVEALPKILDPNDGQKPVVKTRQDHKSGYEIKIKVTPSEKKKVESKKITKSKKGPSKRKAVPGNGYAWGNCTWYVKSKRPDLPNDLGNAESWVFSANAKGIPTGSTPKEGAVGQSGNHVVYVEKINPDGTVLISEMNFNGLGVVSSRSVPITTFTYIY